MKILCFDDFVVILSREWQMTRAFQASMLMYSPEVVFILGRVNCHMGRKKSG